jgi:hypothetical protein
LVFVWLLTFFFAGLLVRLNPRRGGGPENAFAEAAAANGLLHGAINSFFGFGGALPYVSNAAPRRPRHEQVQQVIRILPGSR